MLALKSQLSLFKSICVLSASYFLSILFVQMDELACFAPGMLALGSSGYGPGDSEKYMSLAQEVFVQMVDIIHGSTVYFLKYFQGISLLSRS